MPHVQSQPLQAPQQTLHMTQTMSIQTGPNVIPSSVAPQQVSAVIPATAVSVQPSQGYYPQVNLLVLAESVDFG